MSRWLEAARSAKNNLPPTDKTIKTIETGNNVGSGVGFDGFDGFGNGGTPENETAPPPASPAQPGAVVIHLARGLGLPTHPATCAGCGKADWEVAMRTADGRTWHVACWKAERAK